MSERTLGTKEEAATAMHTAATAKKPSVAARPSWDFECRGAVVSVLLEFYIVLRFSVLRVLVLLNHVFLTSAGSVHSSPKNTSQRNKNKCIFLCIFNKFLYVKTLFSPVHPAHCMYTSVNCTLHHLSTLDGDSATHQGASHLQLQSPQGFPTFAEEIVHYDA